MKLPEFDMSGKRGFIHAAIGGGICFLIMLLTMDIAQAGLQQILVFFGSIGVTIFQQEYALAAGIILLGIVYLPAGFIGGLYTGYQTDENPKILLGITGVLAFVILVIIFYFFGLFSTPNVDYINRILLPFVGNIAGAYLGGYAMNWPGEEEESVESLSVDF